MLKEWPLVAFTILGQTAVGVFLLFHLPFLVRGRAPSPGWFVTWLVVLAFVAVLQALAVLASLFHLRHPLRARFVLSNLRSSWLSREILFELVFLGLVALSGWLAWLRVPARWLHAGSLLAALVAGALFLVSMAKLYMLPALPAWKGIYTPLSFFLTALVLGAVATELVVRVVAGPGAFPVDLTKAAFVLVAVEIAWATLMAPRHGICGVRLGPSLRPEGDAARAPHLVRIALLATGLVFLGSEIATGANDIMKDSGWTATQLLALAFILAGEVAGRLHFYGLVARPWERTP